MRWPETHIAELRRLTDENWSASVIADHFRQTFHVAYTRNAICGKRHKLGLKAPKNKQKLGLKAPKNKQKYRKIITTPRINWPEANVTELRRLFKEGLDDEVIAKDLNRKFGTAYTKNSIIGKCRRPVTLIERQRHQCGWPINDGGPFLFCGDTKDHPDDRYCARHERLARRPPRSKNANSPSS